MKRLVQVIVVISSFCFSNLIYARAVSLRWTAKEDSNSSLEHILSTISKKTGMNFNPNQFLLFEDRNLATSHFQLRVQTSAGLPIENRAIRIWTDLKTGNLIQLEAWLDNPNQVAESHDKWMQRSHGVGIESLQRKLNSNETFQIVHQWVKTQADDPNVQTLDWKDVWSDGELVRIAQVRAKRGKYEIRLLLENGKIIQTDYHPFPREDGDGQTDADAVDEMSLPALVYPIYEEAEGDSSIIPRVAAHLKHLKKFVHHAVSDPYDALRSRHYVSSKFDPILGATKEGQQLGYWSMNWLKSEAARIQNSLPLTENSSKGGGIVLDGKYATINIHPDAVQKFTGIKFSPKRSTQFLPEWIVSGREEELVPTSGYLGQPMASEGDAFSRPARRLLDHNPVDYINDGFDEIQVYYAINTLFDSLRSKGFTDPELSTRPFHAYLYNPDLSMRDNAYYTDDTINFTTYSPREANMARDNSTIWHELGHGVMDRMMGDLIHLADTGGLSEGMADFIAALVIQDVTQGQAFVGSNNFRIKNKTGFFLTNEVHDDGEAYGGALHDFMMLTLQKLGKSGLAQIADLTLESMRLTRNHPHLTTNDWFEHILFADSLGHLPIRKPGELREFLLQALAGRNYDMDGSKPASFVLKNGAQEITGRSLGSRERPIPVQVKAGETAQFHLSAQVLNGASYQFKFPVQVRFYYDRGALQGAVHWDGKESGPKVVTLNSPGEIAHLDAQVSGKCDFSNREDGSCVDYVYAQVWNDGETEKPQAKKRFYIRLTPN
jgi:hypothetical protein